MSPLSFLNYSPPYLNSQTNCFTQRNSPREKDWILREVIQDLDYFIPDLLQLVLGVEGILCMLSDKIDEELLEHAGPQLKVSPATLFPC